MRPFLLIALLSLSACGADAPPLTPKAKPATPEPSFSITGDVAVGVGGKIN